MIKPDNKGASIIALILILSILTALGLVSVSLFSTGIEKSTGVVTSEQAFYAAEAGLESAIGHLKMNPSTANWLWNDGYKSKALGKGTVDAEVLQYDSYPSQTSVSPYCVTLTSNLINTTANPARTILVTVSTDPTVNPGDLGIELYNTDLIASGTCVSPVTLPVAASITTKNPEMIRYRIPEPGSFPTSVTYTVRVLGNTGGAHSLAISHPDQPGFTIANDTRSIIAAGKAGDSRREVFVAFRRQPC